MAKSPEWDQAARNKLKQDAANAAARIRKAFMDMHREMLQLNANAAPLDEAYSSNIIGSSNGAESSESDGEF